MKLVHREDWAVLGQRPDRRLALCALAVGAALSLAGGSVSAQETGAPQAGKSSAKGKSQKKHAKSASPAQPAAPAKQAATPAKPAAPAKHSEANPAELGEVAVSGKKASSIETAKHGLHRVPGAASVIRLEDVERGRAQTAADLLAYQPGVYAQAVGGNDAIRISIRGSGLNRAAGSFREGVNYLFEGLPLTGPGGTPPELMEPLGLEYTEVLKGGNGFQYGGLALGGAVNFVTKTGYDQSSPIQVRLESGSYGYNKGQISTGGVVGAADYYVTAVGSVRSGFQDHSSSDTGRLIGNFGYKFSDKLDTRLTVRYGYTFFDSPGNLTLQQLQNKSDIANPSNVATNAGRRNAGSSWIGSKTTYRFDDDSRVEVGLVAHDYPITILGSTRSEWQDFDLNASLKYFRTDHPFGLTSNSVFGYVSSNAITGDVWTYNTPSPAGKTYGQLLKKSHYGGSNQVLFFSNDLEVLPGLWTTLGNQFIKINRTADITYPVNKSYDRDVYNVAPRFGVRYDATPDIQVFSNITHSVEPADSWKYSGSTVTTGVGGLLTDFRDLKEQTATSVEIGTRGKVGIFDGSIALYRSWLHNQLLTVQIAPGPPAVTANINASPTIMQGVEVGLNTLLWRQGGRNAPAAAQGEFSHQLTLRQAYTFNDFYFEHDSVFRGNTLPGLPTHFYQGELLYEHPLGVFLSFNAQISSSYQADYANTFTVPSYAIFGASLGYRLPKKGFEVHLDARNLTNEKYVTAISPTYNMAGKDSAVFGPGDGLGLFGGFSYQY